MQLDTPEYVVGNQPGPRHTRVIIVYLAAKIYFNRKVGDVPPAAGQAPEKEVAAYRSRAQRFKRRCHTCVPGEECERNSGNIKTKIRILHAM